MSVVHTITRTYRDQSSNPVTKTDTVTGNHEDNIDKSIAVGTDTSLPWTCNRAVLQSLCLYSDVALTIETNSSSAATDTIVLTAGQARVWSLDTDGLAACPFSANVTALFITNAASGPAALKIRALLL